MADLIDAHLLLKAATHWLRHRASNIMIAQGGRADRCLLYFFATPIIVVRICNMQAVLILNDRYPQGDHAQLLTDFWAAVDDWRM